MQITINTDIMQVQKEETLFPQLKALGYAGVDLSFHNYTGRDRILQDDYLSFVLRCCEIPARSGLAVKQTHLTYWPGHIAPPGSGTYQEFEDYMLPILQKEIQVTAALGSNLCVIHLYFEDDREKSRQGNITLIEKLLPVLERHCVTLAFENIYGPDYSDVHLSTAEDLLFYLDYFKHPLLGVCLDTGHAVIRGQDPVTMAQKLQGHIKAIHAHTTLPGTDLHTIPGFMGYSEKIRWKELVHTLRQNSYNGTFNLELSIPRGLNSDGLPDFYSLAYRITSGILGDQS